MTHEQKLQIAAMNAKGKTLKEMVKVTGLNSKEIEAFLAERGKTPAAEEKAPEVKPKKKKAAPRSGLHYTKITPEIQEKIKELHDKGYSNEKIAEYIGCSSPTVAKWIRKFEAAASPNDQPEKTEQGESPVPDDLRKAFKTLMTELFCLAVKYDCDNDLYNLGAIYQSLYKAMDNILDTAKAKGDANVQ